MASSKTPPARALPTDVLTALQDACRPRDKGGLGSQAAVAAKLKVSDATISSALRGKYIGNVDRLAERIRGELLKATVACPVLGEISARICQDEREKPFSAHNPQAVRLWRACKRCPHNPKADPQ